MRTLVLIELKKIEPKYKDDKYFIKKLKIQKLVNSKSQNIKKKSMQNVKKKGLHYNDQIYCSRIPLNATQFFTQLKSHLLRYLANITVILMPASLPLMWRVLKLLFASFQSNNIFLLFFSSPLFEHFFFHFITGWWSGAGDNYIKHRWWHNYIRISTHRWYIDNTVNWFQKCKYENLFYIQVS